MDEKERLFHLEMQLCKKWIGVEDKNLSLFILPTTSEQKGELTFIIGSGIGEFEYEIYLKNNEPYLKMINKHKPEEREYKIALNQKDKRLTLINPKNQELKFYSV